MRAKPFGKRKSRGNKYVNKNNSKKNKPSSSNSNNNVLNVDLSGDMIRPTQTCDSNSVLSTPSTSSTNNFRSSTSKKLSSSRKLFNEFSDTISDNDGERLSTGYQFVDIELLAQAVRSFVQCK